MNECCKLAGDRHYCGDHICGPTARTYQSFADLKNHIMTRGHNDTVHNIDAAGGAKRRVVAADNGGFDNENGEDAVQRAKLAASKKHNTAAVAGMCVCVCFVFGAGVCFGSRFECVARVCMCGRACVCEAFVFFLCTCTYE